MTLTGKRRTVVLVAFLVAVSAFFGTFKYGIYARTGKTDFYRTAAYSSAESTLADIVAENSTVNKLPGGVVLENGRLSQRVTVSTKDGTLPFGGTVTKIRDGFYPGTYEISFYEDTVFDDTVTIDVNINVQPDELVYVLTGDKESGYEQVDVVRASESGKVSFEAGRLCDYTISTTDISGAQRAMADMIDKKYMN